MTRHRQETSRLIRNMLVEAMIRATSDDDTEHGLTSIFGGAIACDDPTLPEREADGSLPAYDAEGFPIAYTLDDGSPLCAGCANGTPDLHTKGHPDGWRLDGFSSLFDSTEEGEPVNCCHCYAMIGYRTGS